MSAIKDDFKKWLVQNDYSKGTANSYVSGINKISEHYGSNAFLINDIAVLKKMVNDYSSKGPYAEIGKKQSGGAIAGLSQWYAYQVNKKPTSLVITLTQGAIDNGYLRIPDSNSIFPEQCLGNEESPALQFFNLYTPDGKVYNTQVLIRRGFIQNRFTSLFKKEKLKENDKAIITKISDFEYQLSFNKADEDNLAIEEQDKSEGGSVLMKNNPLNQILYGPPGTGKTYHTINKSLEILDPEFYKEHKDDRTQLKAKFDEFVKSERIRFVTFHQSFSYEDFIEGIRAEADENDQISYRVEPGVFLKICEKAVSTPKADAKLGISESAQVWKISIGEANGEQQTRQYCFANNQARIGWGHVGDLTQANLDDARFNLGSNQKSALWQFSQDMQQGDIVLCFKSVTTICAVGVVTGDYYYDSEIYPGVRGDFQNVLPVKWLATNLNFNILSLNNQKKLTLKAVYPLPRISWPKLNLALQEEGILLSDIQPSDEFVPEEAQDCVLIIDEINRGNISRIFGELITLIEPSKRAGNAEAISVVLPYSKEVFSVPNNVYLIGTMNTADRSLAGLDMALRRRFTFIEMQPDTETLKQVSIEGINIGELLEIINKRIEALLDRDHCIGHAYFISLNSNSKLEELASIFANQILPLLQEYFFEDWQRIAWVLNDHRKVGNDRFIVNESAKIETLFGSDEIPAAKDLWRLNPTAFERASSYRGIISAEKNAAEPSAAE